MQLIPRIARFYRRDLMVPTVVAASSYEKNQRSGSSSRAEREHLEKYIPCTCFDVVSGKDLTKFRKACVKDPVDHPCLSLQCPFGHIVSYLNAVPDPFGAVRVAAVRNNPQLPHLKLFRARSSVGDVNGVRRFLETPLGIDFILLKTFCVLCFMFRHQYDSWCCEKFEPPSSSAFADEEPDGAFWTSFFCVHCNE